MPLKQIWHAIFAKHEKTHSKNFNTNSLQCMIAYAYRPKYSYDL